MLDTEIPTAPVGELRQDIATPISAPQHEKSAVVPAPLTQITRQYRRSASLAVMNRCANGCELCSTLGCLTTHEVSLEEIDTKFSDFVASGLQWVTFPPNTLLSEHANSISALARCAALVPILRIHPSIGVSASWPQIVTWLKDGGEIEAIFDSVWSESELQSLRRAHHILPTRIRAVVVPRRGTDVLGILASLPNDMLETVEFLFPLPNANRNDLLGCDETRALIANVKSVLPDIKIQPHRSFEVPDPSLPEWFEPRRATDALFESTSLNPAAKLSIIISSYNRKEELINSLRHLQRQAHSADDFEVIIVDDGSDDGTVERIRQHFVRTPARFNFRFYHLPRPYPRKRGDDLMRSSHAKNFGAEKASGSIFAFLDPEILVSTNFVGDLLKQHTDAALVQYPPHFVPFAKSTQRPRYTELKPEDYAIEKQSDWKLGTGLCLSVKRELFYDVGGFSKTFHSYGFEDILLVWQLNKAGVELRDAKEPVFFLEPAAEESEFKNTRRSKRNAMAKSAQTFYMLTLDENFYHAFFPLLGRFVTLRAWMSYLSRSQLGRVLLTPFYGVALLAREPERIKTFFRKFKK